MITYPEIRVVKQQGCRISYWGLLLSWGHSLFLFLFVPDTEGIYVFDLPAAHHAHAPHMVTPHLRIYTSDLI